MNKGNCWGDVNKGGVKKVGKEGVANRLADEVEG